MNVFRRALFLLTVVMPVLLHGQGNSVAEVTKINKIVIDPGHGGKDGGCSYGGFKEKDINLSIALKLGELIKKNLSDVQVIYTRTTDKYLGLAERSDVANKNKADLFLSIHINANDSTSPNGHSPYIMGLDKSEQTLAGAMKENDVIVDEENYETKYEGFEPGDPTSYIMFSLVQSANRDQSMRLAEIMQKHYKADLPMNDFGARQGPLLVLWKCSMPAVLTEVGFLSNASDRKYITTEKGQNEAARSLFNSFSEYKSKTEGRSSVILLKEKGAPAPPVTEQKPAVQETGQAKPAQAQQQHSQAAPADGLRFYVQVATLGKQKNINSADFKSYKGKVVEKKMPNGTYKYLVGGYSGYDEAVRELAKVKKEFKDAFVVAFEGNSQVKLDDARRRAK